MRISIFQNCRKHSKILTDKPDALSVETKGHSTAEPPDIHDPISQKLQILIIEYRKINPTKANLLVKHYMNHDHLAKNKIKLNGLAKTTYYRYLTEAHDWLIDHFFEKERSVNNLLAYHQILDNN